MFLSTNFVGFMKFFDSSLPDDNPQNYYMEREWRILGHMKFDPSDVATLIVPRKYAVRLRNDLPDYFGQIIFSE